MIRGITKFDHTKKWYLSVAGTYILGLALALGNHFYFDFLHDKDASLYNQSWVTIAKNTWARAVQFCLIVSSHTALLALIWSTLSGIQLPVRVVDSALRFPSFLPVLTILFSSSIKQLHTLTFWAVCLFTLAFVTITVPAALVVQPMTSLPTPLRVPKVDMSRNPSLYAVMTSDWRYVSPSNRLHRVVRNMLTSDTVLTWDAPRECQYGCSYNLSYDAPVLKCVDYSPSTIDPSIASNTSYRANFNVSDSYLTLNVMYWPMTNGTQTTESTSLSPTGTRCTFHKGRYTAAMGYSGSGQYALVTNYAQTSDDLLLGTLTGFSNTSSCPYNSSWAAAEPPGPRTCARIQMNSWAFVDAFSSSLSGAIVTYSQSQTLGPEERAVNSALMPNLDYLFTINQGDQSFDLAPWAKKIGLGKALENLFVNATLSLTKDAYTQNGTSETLDALVVPFANKFSFNPRTLWWAYGSAFLTVLGAGMAGWGALASGGLPSEETSLGRILATSRDESFDQLRNRVDGIDNAVICYERVKTGGDQIMAFTMKGEEQGLRKRSLDKEELGLLEKM